MAEAEIISCTWNAADACDNFYEAGFELPNILDGTIETVQILEVLSYMHNKFFHLLGRTATNDRVVLRITSVEVEANILSVVSTVSPDTAGEYMIADEPKPRVTLHGDIQFSLQEVTLYYKPERRRLLRQALAG